MKKKILFLTPVGDIDLDGLFHGYDCVFAENSSAYSFMVDESVVALFVNPNRSTDYLDDRLKAIFPGLRYIATASTGTNHIDKEGLDNIGVKTLSITEERATINKISSTAEHAFLLTLASTRNIVSACKSVENGEWDFSGFVGRQLKELTIGVVGYGRLGTYYANYCDAFGARVQVYDPYVAVAHPRIRQVSSLGEVFRGCDVVSLHVHISNETIGMINKDVLRESRSEACIVNTSRGDVCNEDDLLRWLNADKGHKYATDVLSSEIGGRAQESVLLRDKAIKDQLVVTPHIGGMTREARGMAFRRAAELLEDELCRL